MEAEQAETHDSTRSGEKRSQRALEWPQVRENILNCCQWSGGREKLSGFAIVDDCEELRARQTLIREALKLESEGEGRRLGGLSDPRPALQAASKGQVLDCQDLLDVELLCVLCREVGLLFREREDLSKLKDLMLGVTAQRRLETKIHRSVTRDGKISDEASKTLRQIRDELREAQQKLQKSLQSLLRHPELSRCYQEAIVTQRDGRFVIPVKAEYKGRFPGLVIDESATGSTLFMEPYIAVDQGNTIRRKIAAEQRECHRILVELSQAVGELSSMLLGASERLALLDAYMALARYSLKIDGILPEVVEDGDLVLRKARHPLLGPECVPLDLHLKDGTRTLVITGPNTGGKTVALKTTGLLCMLASSGFPVSAKPGSLFPLIKDVWADIGDEQSLKQSLSTFSAHLVYILEVLDKAGPGSLVLLDELGAGTDPSEGSALGIAIINELHQRGCRTLVSTHLSPLKVHAKSSPGFDNAAVEFNAETLKPTYRLLMGIPGRSNALAIASQLGIPDKLLKSARSYLGGGFQGVEDMLEGLEAEREATRLAENRLRREKEKLRKTRRKLQEERDQLKNSKQEELDQARQESERILAETRRKSRRLMKDFQRGLETAEKERQEALLSARRLAQGWAQRVKGEGLSYETTAVPENEIRFDSMGETARRLARTMEAGLDERGEALPAKVEPPPAPVKPKKAKDPEFLEPETKVFSPKFGQEGTVLQQKGQRVDVKLGTLKMSFQRDELEILSRPKKKKPQPAPQKEARPDSDLANFRVTLDLRGQTVDEATFEMDKFLDRASLAKVERVEILHGKGTGALRKGIQAHLKRHRQVSDFRDGDPYEGGWGVTVVQLH